jgi:Tol biopolymer transport system component
MNMKTTISIFLLLYSFFSISQPNTEVYLFDVVNNKGKITLSIPENISSNEGYDNQPSFSTDGKSIFYARTVDGQTDIARYFVKSGKTKIITSTKQGSEYSPTMMPNGKEVSSIRLDTTGLQLLYAYDFKGIERVLVKDLVIGYHTWINDTDIVTFVLGEPATMQIMNTSSGEATIIGENIGRSLHKIPNGEVFSYVDKSTDRWQIVSMHPKSKEKQVLIPVIFESEDYAWLSSSQIITGHNGMLYTWNIGNEKWNEVFDLSIFGLNEITRIAVSPDGTKLAIVSK